MIRLFNLDLHISVIADFKDITERIFSDNVKIDNWCISGHSWVFGKEKNNVDIVNDRTWMNLDENMANSFFYRYYDLLKDYDGFVVTHTPVFCRLFEKFNKPIILINSCRYDQPYCWTNNFFELNLLNECLRRIYNSGNLIAISNNKADRDYLLLGTGVESIHIPSLCLYTNEIHDYIYASKNHITLASQKISSMDLRIFEILKEKPPTPYTWKDLLQRKALVHIPYEISTMSIFEHYSSGIPLIFPSKSFYKQLILSNQAMLNSYNGVYWKKTPEYLKDTKNIDWWLDRCDFYDTENMKGIYYFNDWNELYNIIKSFETSNDLIEEYINHINNRRNNILDKWKVIIKGTFPNLI